MSLIKRHFYIKGMFCINCQNRIERKLGNTSGIEKIDVSYSKNTADILYDPERITFKQICNVIESLGYEVQEKEEYKNTVGSICMLVIIIAMFVLFEQLGILNMLVPGKLADTEMGYGMLFVTGLVTSVHCIAMCGGINLSQCIAGVDVEENKKGGFYTAWSAFLYNLGRVISYTLIGAALGLAGMLISGDSQFGVSTFIQGIIKMIAGIVMVIMGINMLGIFPGLRRFHLRIPILFASKNQRKTKRQPLMTGLLNGFMPCGSLQALQIIAFASGNPLVGALSMLTFCLGTVPLMMGLSSVVSVLGSRFKQEVINVGAVLVTVFGLAMLFQGGSLSGVLLSPQSISTDSTANAEIVDGVQIVKSTLSS
ncbi:MAG: sulfite exporter TauE/SafE family protein [Lachnospiraceae bacterium]